MTQQSNTKQQDMIQDNMDPSIVKSAQNKSQSFNVLDDIEHFLSDNFIAPDQDVLELTKPLWGKKKEAFKPLSMLAVDRVYVDNLVKKRVDEWLNENMPRIIRQILNAKIDKMNQG